MLQGKGICFIWAPTSPGVLWRLKWQLKRVFYSSWKPCSGLLFVKTMLDRNGMMKSTLEKTVIAGSAAELGFVYEVQLKVS